MTIAKETAKTTKAVTAPQNTALATMPERTVVMEGLVPSDIIIPKVLLMQGLSDFVAKRQANLGDIVRSTTGEKLGNPEKPVEFIPLSFPQSYWVIEQKINGKFKYKTTVPRDAKNSGDEWTFWSDQNGNEVSKSTLNAIESRRVQRLACYALLPSDIEAELAEKKKAENGEMPDLSKALTPVLLSFRSLSFKAGKEVVTFFTQAASFKTQAWRYVLKLTCHHEQNDKGQFYLLGVDRNKPPVVKEELLPVVEYWVNVVNSQNLVVDEAHEDDAPTSGKVNF